MEGWIPDGTQQVWGDYGEWSDWSTNEVNESDERQVESTTLYRYYFFYCSNNCGRHEPYSGYCDCGAPIVGYEVKWSPTPYNQSSPTSYDSRKMYTTSLGDGQRWNFSSGNLNASAIGTIDADSDAEVILAGYRYRTRELNTIYVFYRWVDWTDWSDTEVTPSDDLEVETRTVYRYVTGPFTEHSWNDWAVTTPATTTQDGVETRTCSKCNTTETRPIPAIKEYTVTYNANGGTGAPEDQTKTHGVVLTLSATVPTRGGYTFKGWATSADAMEAQYQPSGSFTADADTMLYAVWEHDVVASGAWGDLDWVIDSDRTLTISGSGPMDTGAYLSGSNWTDHRQLFNKVVIKEGVTSVGIMAFTMGTNITHVSLPDSLTRIGGLAFANCTHLSDVVIPEHVMSIDGGAFGGSALTQVLIPASVVSIGEKAFSARSLVNVTFEGKAPEIEENAFENVEATVNFPANEESWTESMRQNYGGVLSWVACTADGHRYGAPDWSWTNDYGNASATFTYLDDNSTQTLTATVTSTQTEPSCTVDGGLMYTASVTFNGQDYTDSKTVVSPASGHTPDLRNVKTATANENGYTGDMVCTVCGEVLTRGSVTYFVAFNSNSGTDTPDSQVKIHDTALTLTTSTPTRANASAGSYTVTLNANGGDLSTTSLTAVRSTSYSFESWNTATDGSGTSYAPGASYTANAAVTLYAQWNSNTTTAAITLPMPTREGYNFIGWGTTENATEGITGQYTPSDNGTLYAIWESSGLKTGTRGNLSWVLDSDGLLTISLLNSSGSTTMGSFSSSSTDAWLAYRDGITHVVVEQGVTSIGSHAFLRCNSLTDVVLPDGITSIGSYAFYEDSILANLNIPDSVTSIGNWAFSKCNALKDVSLPDGLQSIGQQAFEFCSSIRSIDIPRSIESIGSYAFSECSYLSNVTIPGSLTNLVNGAFYKCVRLTNVTIHDGLESIGNSAFSNCTNLKTVTIPASVTTIGSYAFSSCNKLKDGTINYGGSQEQWNEIIIGDYNDPLLSATITCAVVTSYSVSYDANGGENAPEVQEKIPGTELILSSEIPTHEFWVFHGWAESADATAVAYLPGGSFTKDADTTLYAVWTKPDFILPDALTEIGEEAFANCAFTYVKLSENTDTIGKNAFANCTNLKYIYIPENCLWIDRYAFTGVTGLTILGADGSYAKTYASGKGFDFIAVS